MYGATSGDWKRSYDKWTEAPASPATATPHRQRPPRQSSTLPAGRVLHLIASFEIRLDLGEEPLAGVR
jgi:hypothetical protein